MTERGPFQRADVALTASPDGIRDVTVLSDALGRRADVSFYTPPGHEADSCLPIVILLHGVYGSHWAWSRNGAAHTALSDLVSAGRVRPMILAMPSDGLFGVGSGYLARPGEDAERWIVDEVPLAAELVHPGADVTSVSVAGLSMGGWGALRLAGQFPSRFLAAVGMSPLTRLAHIAEYAPDYLKSAHTPVTEYVELADLLSSRSNELPPLRIVCGTEDGLIDEVRRLHAHLDLARVRHEYSETQGTHAWDFWSEQIKMALLFIDAAGQAQAK